MSETGNEGGTREQWGSSTPTFSTTVGSRGVPAGGGRHGYVYFIVGMDSGRIKIGRATDPERRVRALQTGCAEELGLLGVIPSREPELLERKIHRRFAHLSLRGEWFEGADEIGEFVERYGYDLTVAGVPDARIWSYSEDGPPPKLRLAA